MASSESEFRALLNNRDEASRARDIDRLMSLYSPNIVYFDCVPPIQGFIGADAVRRNFLRWFNEYQGDIGLETHQLKIAISGDVAFAHMLHLDKGNANMAGGQKRPEFLVRSSVCCQRSNNRWLIMHEHISIPVKPELWSTVLNDIGTSLDKV
jgi:ketosteroid isomerase-like protein